MAESADDEDGGSHKDLTQPDLRFRSESAYRAEPVRLSDQEKIDWLRLIRSDNIGPVTFHELLKHCGSARAALEALPELGRHGGGRKARRIASRDVAESEFERARKCGARLVALPDSDYPALLRHIPAPPPILFLKGRPELGARKTVAIVGSRNASAAGQQFTGQLANDLGQAGVIIASGLARGIDTSAHRAALPTGTIAAIAGGIDMVYPPENSKLHHAISEEGLLISENPPGFAPRGQDFPRRNRIISGVSSAVIIVEAARKSGSLITARLALEQGRDVFAVPGHPLDPRAAGTNGLIKGGAQLITSADDILSDMFPSFRANDVWSQSDMAEMWTRAGTSPNGAVPHTEIVEAGKQIMDALSFTPIHPDSLMQQTGLSARAMTVALLELDLGGYIERHEDQSVSLKPAPISIY